MIPKGLSHKILLDWLGELTSTNILIAILLMEWIRLVCRVEEGEPDTASR